MLPTSSHGKRPCNICTYYLLEANLPRTRSRKIRQMIGHSVCLLVLLLRGSQSLLQRAIYPTRTGFMPGSVARLLSYPSHTLTKGGAALAR